jgi:N-hydroxyarylamine O-acetyltransferase
MTATTSALLLEHLGLNDVPAPDLAGLRRVQRAYAGAVPYEDLAVQLGESEPLAPARLAERILSGRRGGYCFELNAVLAQLLESLGFAVTRHEAVVGGEGPTNHMTLLVELDGERWLVDAGLGEGFLDPLPLREGEHRGTSAMTWTLEREPAGTWWCGQPPWSSFPGFRMTAGPAPLAAFDPHHARLSTSPASPFVQTLCVQRPADDRFVTLRARTLTELGPAVDLRSVVSDRAAFTSVLRDTFGIDVAALGQERLGRLWRAAWRQHDAYVARAAQVVGGSPASAATAATTCSGDSRASTRPSPSRRASSS